MKIDFLSHSSEPSCGFLWPMSISPEATFTKFERALFKGVIKIKMLTRFKKYVARLVQNGQTSLKM